MKKTTESGFTLVEVLISFTILIILTAAVSRFFLQANAYSEQNNKKLVAVNLARQIVEAVEASPPKDVTALTPAVQQASNMNYDTCVQTSLLTQDQCSGFYKHLINNTHYTVKLLITNGQTDEWNEKLVPFTARVDYNDGKDRFVTVEGNYLNTKWKGTSTP